MGWEFYKDTRVLYGTVIVGDKEYIHPAPTRMIWRPDKMICEYELEDILIEEKNSSVKMMLPHRSLHHPNPSSSASKATVSMCGTVFHLLLKSRIKKRTTPSSF